MEEIIRRDDFQYIIVRGKGNGKEYYDGANLYGRDNAGILKVSKVEWSKTFTPIHASYDKIRMENILEGMRKYGKIEDEYSYFIAEIQTTTAIISYIF